MRLVGKCQFRMFKFFRRIRQELLAKGKTKQYLKYAIGEIVLVVIGILIALQINTWKEQEKLQRTETNYIRSIKEDLQRQLASIDTQIVYEQTYVRSANSILNNFKQKGGLKLDRIFFLDLTNLLARKTFIINDAAYTDLISSGNINIISNDSIKNQIIMYYQELERISMIIQNNNIHIVDGMIGPVIIRFGYYYSDEENSSNTASLNYNPLIDINKSFDSPLVKASKKILSDPSSQLELFNAINQRYVLAFSHLGYMNEERKITAELIDNLSLINK